MISTEARNPEWIKLKKWMADTGEARSSFMDKVRKAHYRYGIECAQDKSNRCWWVNPKKANERNVGK